MTNESCFYCKEKIEGEDYVELLDFRDGKNIPVKAHTKCWHKDLNSDSGNYFDNFVD